MLINPTQRCSRGHCHQRLTRPEWPSIVSKPNSGESQLPTGASKLLLSIALVSRQGEQGVREPRRHEQHIVRIQSRFKQQFRYRWLQYHLRNIIRFHPHRKRISQGLDSIIRRRAYFLYLMRCNKIVHVGTGCVWRSRCRATDRHKGGWVREK